jgi:secondary thiamine-phosphate synthase enzyme
MSVITRSFKLKTSGDGEIADVTGEVSSIVGQSTLKAGTVTVFVPGSTGAITTIEHEPGLVEDMSEMFDRLIPREREYHHNLRWHDGNGHAHVRAALLGPSLTVPFTAGRLMLGVWQQIILIDFDNRPRDREIVCQLIGE